MTTTRVVIEGGGLRGPEGGRGDQGYEGPKGSRGDAGAQGIPGVNAVDNDDAVADYLGTYGDSASKQVGAEKYAPATAHPITQQIAKNIAANDPVRVLLSHTSIGAADFGAGRVMAAWMQNLFGESAFTHACLGALGGDYATVINGWEHQHYGGCQFTRLRGKAASGTITIAEGYFDHLVLECSRETDSVAATVKIDGVSIGSTPGTGSQAYRQQLTADVDLGFHVVTVDAPASGHAYLETVSLIDTSRRRGVEVIDCGLGGTGFVHMQTLYVATAPQVAGIPIVGDNGFDYYFDRDDIDLWIIQQGTNDDLATLTAGADFAVEQARLRGLPLLFIIEPSTGYATQPADQDKREYLLSLRRYPWVRVVDWHRLLWPAEDLLDTSKRALMLSLWYADGEITHPDERGYDALIPVVAEAMGLDAPPVFSEARLAARRRFTAADLEPTTATVAPYGTAIDLPTYPERTGCALVSRFSSALNRPQQIYRTTLPLGPLGGVSATWLTSGTSDEFGKYQTNVTITPGQALVGQLYRITARIGYHTGGGTAVITVPTTVRFEDDEGNAMPEANAGVNSQVYPTFSPGEVPGVVSILARVNSGGGGTWGISGQRVYEVSVVAVASPDEAAVLDDQTVDFGYLSALPFGYRRGPQVANVESKARRYQKPAGVAYEMDSITDPWSGIFSSGTGVPYFRDLRAAQRAKVDTTGGGYNVDPNTYIAASGSSSGFGNWFTPSPGAFRILSATAGQEFEVLVRANGVVSWQASTNAQLVVDGVNRSSRVYNYLQTTTTPAVFAFRVMATANGDLDVLLGGRVYGLWAVDSSVPLITT